MRRRELLIGLAGALLPAAANASETDGDPLPAILAGPALQVFRDAARRFEIQILYTQIDRTAGRPPALRTFGWRADPKRWFHPASLVKLPLAACVLERVGALGIGLDARLQIEGGTPCQPARIDAEPINRLLRRMLVVSDNLAYNCLFDFVGRDALNQRLWSMAYTDVRIARRFTDCDAEANRRCAAWSLRDARGSVVYREPARLESVLPPWPHGGLRKGRAWLAAGRLHRGPKDFRDANALPLHDAHAMLSALVFPGSAPAAQRFHLREGDRLELLRTLQMRPRDARDPSWSEAEHPDHAMKFLVFGDREERIPDGLRSIDKVGEAYGYLSDCAYLADDRTRVDCLLSAVVFVDKDGVLGDGRYAYDTLGRPFLGALGRALLKHEATRERGLRDTVRLDPS